MPSDRPPEIRHWRDLQEADDSRYPDSAELLAIGAPFGVHFGFERLGIHHVLIPPGRRTSWPHAEKTEDEFAYVISGTPDVWIDGTLYRLMPGDGVGFKAGTGVCHSFLNNTGEPVQLLVVGDRKREDNRYFYPLHPKRNAEIGGDLWRDPPPRATGPHDGKLDKLRESDVV